MDRRASLAPLALILLAAFWLPACQFIAQPGPLPTTAAVAQPFPTPLVATPSTLAAEAPTAVTTPVEGWTRSGTPPAASLLSPSAVATTPTAATSTAVPPTDIPPTVTTAPTTAVPVCQPRREWPVYRVQRGDTLAALARATGSTLIELMTANCLTDPNRIETGSVLYVPRLPVSPTATLTPALTATTTPAGSVRYLSPPTGIQFDYPAHWTPNGREPFMGFGAADGFVQVGLLAQPEDLDFQANAVAFGENQLYGSSPTIERLTLSNGTAARLISPSADQAPQMRGQTALVTYLPAPVVFMGTPFNYLVLAADSGHMPEILNSLRLPDPPALVGIDFFTAAAEDAPDGGKRITFRWEGSGVTRGMIAQDISERFFPSWPVLSRGQQTLNFGAPEFPDPTFTLRLWNDVSGRQVEQTLTVPWACANSYFFSPPPAHCAQQPPVVVNGAYQRFERGRMLWLPQYGINTVHILYDTGELQTYVDEWSTALPEIDPSIIPPDGLFQPARGFGLIWREVPSVRDRLGWATATESGTIVTYQNETRLSSPAVTYMTLPDGEIVRMTEATWATFNPGQP